MVVVWLSEMTNLHVFCEPFCERAEAFLMGSHVAKPEWVGRKEGSNLRTRLVNFRLHTNSKSASENEEIVFRT